MTSPGQILEWRATDGWATPQTFTPPALPGVWQPTPPAFAPAAFVQAGDVKPFGLPTPYYFLPRRPPALNSQEYADAVNEIKAIGGATSTVRTEEQTLQARLWASVGYKTLWAGIWNQVTRHMASDRKLSLIESARLFALVNSTMQDGVQTAQASKFVYQLWRPVHAIQRAGEDMNAGTDADPTWMPLLTTPPYPSYAGNMACIGASAARALSLLLRHRTTFRSPCSGPASPAMPTWRVRSRVSGSSPSTRPRAASTAASTTTSTPRRARRSARRWPATLRQLHAAEAQMISE